MTIFKIDGIEQDLIIGIDETPCKSCNKLTISVDSEDRQAYKCTECKRIK